MDPVPPNNGDGDNDEEKPLSPTSIAQKLDEQLKLGSGASGSRIQPKKAILGLNRGCRYADNRIARVVLVGLNGDNAIPSSVELKRYSCESYDLKTGNEYFAMVRDHGSTVLNEATPPPMGKDPWLCIVEKIEKDVLTSFQNVRRAIESHGSEDIGISLVARLGRILFYGDEPLNFGLIKHELLHWPEPSETIQTKKVFYTTVPDAYVEHVKNKVKEDYRFGSMYKKDRFLIKMVHKYYPTFLVICKCRRKKGGKLQLLKVATDTVRHLKLDLPLFVKPLDLRLMLCTKSKRETVDQVDVDEIVEAAILDSNVKGGLRWPPEDSICGSLIVQEFSHLKTKVYGSSFMKVKLRCADRFDMRNSVGEYGYEVTSQLTDLKKYLKGKDVGGDAELVESLKEALRFIWDDLLDWDGVVDVTKQAEIKRVPLRGLR